MSENKKCLECGSEDNLIELKNGKYGCMKCLDKLGKEQKQIEKDIVEYLKTNYKMDNPLHQANCLQAISHSILYKNNLLSEDKVESIKKTYDKMFLKDL